MTSDSAALSWDFNYDESSSSKVLSSSKPMSNLPVKEVREEESDVTEEEDESVS